VVVVVALRYTTVPLTRLAMKLPDLARTKCSPMIRLLPLLLILLLDAAPSVVAGHSATSRRSSTVAMERLAIVDFALH
jgi:hypothetical protein